MKKESELLIELKKIKNELKYISEQVRLISFLSATQSHEKVMWETHKSYISASSKSDFELFAIFTIIESIALVIYGKTSNTVSLSNTASLANPISFAIAIAVPIFLLIFLVIQYITKIKPLRDRTKKIVDNANKYIKQEYNMLERERAERKRIEKMNTKL